MLILTQIVFWLAPHLGQEVSGEYAEIIKRAAIEYKVDPHLIVTIIHVESGKSWDRFKVSDTRDFGLGQIHVSRSTNPELLGKEDLLFDPELNIEYTAKSLRYWKSFHRKRCKGEDHPFYAHYKWGCKVKTANYHLKIKRVYDRVKREHKRMVRSSASGTSQTRRRR